MKKVITLLKYAGAVFSMIIAVSCGKFEDLNYSPNSASQPQTPLLFSSVMRRMTSAVDDGTPRTWMQQTTETFYTAASRYNVKNFSYSSIYTGPLQDITLIISLNTEESTKSQPNVLMAGSNETQIAVARILRAFFFQFMTDKWGDIPYSEALKGLEIVTPKFDTQESIYTDLFNELTEASQQLGSGTLNGDILFNGDLNMWKVFANTIRLNMALRLSKVDPAKGKEEFNKALQAGVISSVNENIYYRYLAESANQSPIFNNYEVTRRYDNSITDVMVDALNAISDPRVTVYADPNVNGDYVGMPYGLTSGEITEGGYKVGTVSVPDYISLYGKKFRAQDASIAIFTYAGTQFAIAEAYKLGWITGQPDDANAEIAYKEGILASMDEHDVSVPESYFLQPAVAYTPATAIEKIITQKWMANYMGYGVEAWSDWRRTGYPTLEPSPNPLSLDKNIPRRQAYDITEGQLNGANYEEVIKRQGPDELATRIWWDKE